MNQEIINSITDAIDVHSALVATAEVDASIKLQQKRKLVQIKEELELARYLFGKYGDIITSPESVNDALADDAVRLYDNFEKKYASVINERMMEYKRQINKSAFELLKKDEVSKVKIKYVRDIRDYLLNKGDETALNAFVEADNAVRLNILPEDVAQ